ncbi:MAG: Rrf2 family transcriptional regulator [Firmicutes bacterium]|nr:Rrf2 family transcriptional regulator [Bacillota bacterium]
MYITTKGRYGTKALFELALRYGEGPVPLREIAEKQGLSEHYLEQLFAPLRKAGLVQSVRGAQGGYMLARDPQDITVGDVLRVLEGPIAPTECSLGGPDYAYRFCGEKTVCVAQDVWIKVRRAIEDVVDHITLADLVEQDREARQRMAHMYYI